MKRAAIFLVISLIPIVVHAQDTLRIEEVGLRGFFITASPTPVRIHIPALSGTPVLRLECTVRSGDYRDVRRPTRIDRFEEQLRVVSGKSTVTEVPVLLTSYPWQELQVTATAPDGKEIGEASLKLAPPSGAPVAIYCAEDRQCLDAQARIFPIQPAAEHPNPGYELRFVLLKELRSNWLAYKAASAVLLAGSISRAVPAEIQALEYYLRSGGKLVLLTNEIGNSNFLAAYRESATRPAHVLVGNGDLYLLSGAKGNELSDLFAQTLPYGERKIFSGLAFPPASPIEQFLPRVSNTFSFPRLPWLIAWISLYILVTGLGNFAILRRFRKLEWGWVTVGASALIFAASLYLISSSHRPKQFTLDCVNIFWMDGHSGTAYVTQGYRISSPQRTAVTLSVDQDVFITPSGYQGMDASQADIGEGIIHGRHLERGWQVELAPPLRIATPMLRWSLQDFYTIGMREFPGTVHWTSPNHLKNDSGETFREAAFFDRKANKRYGINSFVPGQEINLENMPSREIVKKKNVTFNPNVVNEAEMEDAKKNPFSLDELPYQSAGLFSRAGRVFVGLISYQDPKAGLDKAGTMSHRLDLIVVALDEP